MDAFTSTPIPTTMQYVHLPLMTIIVPIAIVEKLHARRQAAVIGSLTDVLRALSSTNSTGQTFLEAVGHLSASGESSKLVRDLEGVRSQTIAGRDIKVALADWANRYQERHIARIARLIIESVRASSDISDTLNTAAQTSSLWDAFRENKTAKIRSQLTMVFVTFLIMLGILVVFESTFITQLAEVSGGGMSSGPTSNGVQNPSRLVMLAFHASTIQAVSAGLIAGYLKKKSFTTGTRYASIMVGLTIVAFMLV
jgi:flagellar protein FlaJ